MPAFLVALFAVRGLPALLYRKQIGSRQAFVAALLQATSLPFIVAATMIGLDLGLVEESSAAALIAAGLLSVVVFPVTALALLRDQPSSAQRDLVSGNAPSSQAWTTAGRSR